MTTTPLVISGWLVEDRVRTWFTDDAWSATHLLSGCTLIWEDDRHVDNPGKGWVTFAHPTDVADSRGNRGHHISTFIDRAESIQWREDFLMLGAS